MKYCFKINIQLGAYEVSIVASILFYVIPASIIIWFMVSVVSAQRRRNRILEQILEELKNRK